MHLMISGGRKAMSIYATLAAAQVFGPNDPGVGAVLVAKC